jgi:hypothetical protein
LNLELNKIQRLVGIEEEGEGANVVNIYILLILFIIIVIKIIDIIKIAGNESSSRRLDEQDLAAVMVTIDCTTQHICMKFD